VTELKGPFQSEMYGGVGVGLAELTNAQAYTDSGARYGTGGNTVEFGPTLGVYRDTRWFGLFAEVSYRWRRLPSLKFEGSDEEAAGVPGIWPRSLDLSGAHLAAGLQINLRRSPLDAATPQVWTLARVDAEDLPAIIGVRAEDSTTISTEVLFGTLTLTDTVPPNDTIRWRRYVLDLHTRDVTRKGETILAMTTRTSRIERGRYRVVEDDLLMQPDGGLPGYTAIRYGNQIRIRDGRTGYGLVFQQSGAEAGASKSSDDEES
jgi:hypothetical protein